MPSTGTGTGGTVTNGAPGTATTTPTTTAQPVPPAEPDAKMVKGMAVLGNNEAPMSLFIVPWKTSELGVETNLKRTLNERDVPVDREVFLREIAFYQASVGGRTTPAALTTN